jgi:putative nucleotidyltransferase with HDIG domain
VRQGGRKSNGVTRPGKRKQTAGERRLKAIRHATGRAAVFVLFAISIALVMTAGRRPLDVRLGEPARRDYKARIGFTSTDIEGTRAVREQARLAAPVVFRTTRQDWQDSVRDLLGGLERGKRALLWQRLPEELDKRAFLELLPRLAEKRAELEQGLLSLSDVPTVRPEDLAAPMVEERPGGQALLSGNGDAERTVPLSDLICLDGADARFRQALQPVLGGLAPPSADLVCSALAAVANPGAVLDPERSREKAEAAQAVPPEVARTVQKGRTILARGSEVSRQHIEDLLAERDRYWASDAGRVVAVQHLGGLAVVLLIIMAGATFYAVRYRPELLRQRLQMLSFTLLTLALVAMARLCVIWGVTPLVVPLPMMVMIMCLVYDQRFALDVAVFYALLVRLTCPGADEEFFALLLGGIITALLSGRVRTRSTLIKAGLYAGGTQFCAVWGLGLIAVVGAVHIPLRFWDSPLLWNSVAAFAGGLGSGFVVSGMLPAIETLFGVTTDIRLLEWSDPNQPLLQQLLLDAPGSYHHSMVVGSLAADAAEAIGANPLLARVSAYFHDVGKLKKPEYFAENLPQGGKNPHDALSPTMSSLIITAHPKDGAEMAEQYGVPRPVRDIVLQSHGSSVLRYFWEKARTGSNGRGDMEERSFRYRLPKPGSKEAAIVMLCDATESAARSMDSPSVGQLRNLVREILRDRLNDGQLDESGLTLTDLKHLEDCLVHGLTAVFHSRVSYPGQETPEQNAHNGHKGNDDDTPGKPDGTGNQQQAERS